VSELPTVSTVLFIVDTVPVYSLFNNMTSPDAYSGSSIAGVALDHGLNANMVHRWLDEYEAGIGWAKHIERQAQFVAISMAPSAVMQEPASHDVLPSGFIEIEVTRGKSRISMKWPVDAANACATMLGQLLT
jgi:transposase